MIACMLSLDPKIRPSTDDIIHMSVFKTRSSQLTVLGSQRGPYQGTHIEISSVEEGEEDSDFIYNDNGNLDDQTINLLETIHLPKNLK